MRIISLSQGSADWLTWRKTGLGSSDAPVLWCGEHFGRTPESLLEEKLGLKKDRAPSGAMSRGHKLEPVARGKYQKLFGLDPRPLCGVHDEHEALKASLDGWVESHKLVVEIKAPNRNDHLEALNGKVPLKYQPQLDHLLLVTGGRQAHYVSYSDYFEEPQDFAVVVWPREEERIHKLLQLELDFLKRWKEDPRKR